MPSSMQPWATLEIQLTEIPSEQLLKNELIDRMEALASVLAQHEWVHGVETREGPSALVYIDPSNLEELASTVQSVASALELSVHLSKAIHEGDDWHDCWKQFYQPIIFGQGALLLRPSWIARKAEDPQREIVLDPGRAFGTGLHESTQLCIHLLVDLTIRQHRTPTKVLDLGCGSGILALAAARLWPSLHRVLAVDCDPEAVDIARENVEQNGLATLIESRSGTISEVHEMFDLILANIRPEVLLPLATLLHEYVNPSGLIILSGILSEEAVNLQTTYQQANWHILEQRTQGEWVALLCQKPSSL